MPITKEDIRLTDIDTRPVAVTEPIKIVDSKAEEPQKRVPVKWTTPGAFKSEHR